jgi:hypothetical protein
VVLAFAFYFKDNMKALLFYQFLLLGSISLGLSPIYFTRNLNPFSWMVVSGFGYICYVPFNCFLTVYRSFQIKVTLVLIYLADAFGYLALLFLLYKNFGQSGLSWINFFMYSAYSVAGNRVSSNDQFHTLFKRTI